MRWFLRRIVLLSWLVPHGGVRCLLDLFPSKDLCQDLLRELLLRELLLSELLFEL